MQTYSERLESLEEKVDKVLNVLNPEQTEEKDEVVEKLHDLNKDVNNINGKLHFLTLTLDRIEEEVSSRNVQEEEKVEDLTKFNTDRNVWFIAAAMVSLSLTLLCYYLNTILFLIPAGLFMAFLGILFLIFVDWKLTPGDSFARIAKSAVGTAITLAIIAGFFFIGIFIGQQFIPDSFRGEASQRIEERLNSIESQLHQTPKEEKPISETPSDNDKQSGDGSGIPNR